MKIWLWVSLFLAHMLCFAGIAVALEKNPSITAAAAASAEPEKGLPENRTAVSPPPSREIELKQALSQYSYHQKAMVLIEEYRSLLQSFADIAEERFKANQGSQHDVLMAQLETLKLVGRQIEHERQLNTTRAHINRLLSRSPETQIETPSHDSTFNELPYSLEELHRSALKNAVHAGRYGEDSSKVVRRNVQNRNEPAATADIYSALERSYSEAMTAQRLIKLYKTSLIPLAGVALESALGSYQAGTTSFQQVIDTFLISLEAQMDFSRVAADYRQALVEMEVHTGLDLTREKENANAS
jgi:outer membrane protein TolC